MQFGSLAIASEPVQSWIGTRNASALSPDDESDSDAEERGAGWAARGETANCGQHDATALHYQVRRCAYVCVLRRMRKRRKGAETDALSPDHFEAQARRGGGRA
jgi:hypothetical protein